MGIGVPVATSSALLLMQASSTLHPAGGGTVVLAALALGTPIDKLSYDLLTAVTLTSTLVVMGGYLNNLGKGKKYPNGEGPQIPSGKEMLVAGTCAFFGMSFLSAVHWGLFGGSPQTMIIGTMGASAVLVWAAPQAPQAQPYNVIGGHIISAVIGVSCYKLLGAHGLMWLAVPVATSASIVAMKITGTTHSAGGGTALVACLVPSVYPLGYLLVLTVALTSTVIVAGGFVLNNLSASLCGLEGRRYPKGFSMGPVLG